jgi:hypothetical protein
MRRNWTDGVIAIGPFFESSSEIAAASQRACRRFDHKTPKQRGTVQGTLNPGGYNRIAGCGRSGLTTG